MINGFLNTVQNDTGLVFNAFVGKQPASKEQNEKVGFAALRLIAAVGMVVSGLVALTAAPYFAAAPVGTLFKMAFAVGSYALSHDVFVLAKNATEQKNVVNAAGAGARAIYANVIGIFTGKKDADDPLIHPVTENTFFRPFWDQVLAK